MQIPVDQIKALRERTNAGVLDCKKALQQAGGDLEVAADLLRQSGYALALKKASRVAREGLVEAYVHAGGRLGALVELNCETDFVARTNEFKSLAHDLAMQVAATNPTLLSPDEIPEDNDLDPTQACLLLQPFIKDPQKTVQELITETIAKTGERIRVRRFARFELGESDHDEPAQV